MAKQLGNRPATRKYCIHPAVIVAYTKGWLLSMMPDDDEEDKEGLHPEEHAVLCIIGKHFEQQQ